MASRSTLIKGLVAGDLKFFRTTAPEEELQKGYWTPNTNKVVHNIKMREESDIINPHFTIPYDDSIISHPYNYCYYFDNKRFYWIRNVKKLPQGQMELVCSVDPLYSFVNQIFNMTAFEDRGSHIGTGYVEDNEIIFNASPQAEVHEFSEINKGFTGESYFLTVSNIMGYKTDTDFEEELGYDTSNYLYSNTSPTATTSIVSLINKMKEWQLADWVYSQTLRMSDGYVDCSSLIARAFYEALGATFLGGDSWAKTASGIAEWFYDHEAEYTYGIFPLGDHYPNETRSLQEGDLIFFETTSNERKERFPCSGYIKALANETEADRKARSEKYKLACSHIFGQERRDLETPYYGVGHIGFVYRGLNSPTVSLPTMVGYKFATTDTYIKTATDATAVIPDSGIWTIEGLPQKIRQYTSLNEQGAEQYFNGSKATYTGVIFQKRGTFVKREGEDTLMTNDWGDYKPYFAIRPAYDKIMRDLASLNNE